MCKSPLNATSTECLPVKLTHWLSGLFFQLSVRSFSRRAHCRSVRRNRISEGARRLADVERLEERVLLTVAPVFEQSSYAATVLENAAQDTWVLNVWANDGDGDMVTFQFDTASSTAPFAIDSSSGDITVNGPLDAATQSEYTLTAQAVDPGELVGSTTVTISVTAVNDPPQVTDDSYSVDENDVLTVSTGNGVLANDSDPDGDPLTVHLDTDATYGFLDLLGDGSFSYTPDPNYSGYDGFYYYVSDGTQNSDIAYVEIEVLETSTNTPPEAYDDNYTISQDQSLTVNVIEGVLANDYDAEGDALTAHLDADGQNGHVVLQQDGSFVYQPDAGYVGSDSFSYHLNDGLDDGNSATVTIDVTGTGNVAPAFDSSNYSGSIQDDASVGTLVLGVWASDADGDSITYQFEAASSSAPFAIDSSTGDITVDGTLDAATQSEYTLTVEAVDPGALVGTATVTISVTSAGSSGAPTAVDDSYEVAENAQLTINAAQGLLVNDTDPENDPLTATVENGPQYGILNLSDDGSFVYTPNSGYTGQDSFTYRAYDGQNTSNTATVTLTITASNAAPVANDDLYVVGLDTQLVVPTATGLLANDTDADNDTLTAAVAQGPSHGTLVLLSDGSFTFDPESGYTGVDSFTYRADDGIAMSDVATVTLEIGLPPLSVDNLQLVQDTGNSSSDLVTWDPRITGTVDGGFGVGTVNLEWDHDGDGTAEGVLSFGASGQSFVYNPLRFDPALNGFTGSLSLQYRLVKRDAAGNIQSTGGWQDFDYTLESPPAVDGLTVDDFGLWLDTGDSDYDRDSVHPTVVGTVNGTTATGSGRVEFDHNGDGVEDGQVDIATAGGESFQYDPRDSDPALADYLGDLVLNYRLVRLDGDGAVTDTGPWVAYDLTVVALPPSTDTIVSLALVNDTQGGQVTWDPTLTGQVQGTASQAYRPVELDLDGDGTVDLTARTRTALDSAENVFTATPHGLAYGSQNIYVRALEWSTSYQAYLRGPWESFTFELVPNPATQVTALGLETDTGDSDSDGITTDDDIGRADGRIAGNADPHRL